MTEVGGRRSEYRKQKIEDGTENVDMHAFRPNGVLSLSSVLCLLLKSDIHPLFSVLCHLLADARHFQHELSLSPLQNICEAQYYTRTSMTFLSESS
jgi:hypothetical protein